MSSVALKLNLPLSKETIVTLQAGKQYLLSGEIFTARDEAHKRLVDLIQEGRPLPFELASSAIFYCGPSPTPAGRICGSVGPTTSSRMDFASPLLIEQGLLVMIGKGDRSPVVKQAIQHFGAAYFTCSGGIAALLSKCIVSCETYAWPELGTEAVYRLVVKELPVYLSDK